MKTFQRITSVALLAAGLSVFPSAAAEQQADRQQSSFEGTISSYNQSANTVTVGGETYQLLPTTRFTRSDTPASKEALAVGQKIEGQYKASAEGKREVLTANITAAEGDARQGGEFQGEIASYNKSANTLRVDGETYQLLPTSRVMREQARASTNDLAAGQRVEGRYKDSAEGRREVLTLQITRDRDRAVGAAGDNVLTDSGATFQGRIGRINRDANTITVDGTAYHVLPTTRIIGRSGAAVTLSDLNRDQRVQGTYKESTEGRREVLSMEIGRRNNNN